MKKTALSLCFVLILVMIMGGLTACKSPSADPAVKPTAKPAADSTKDSAKDSTADETTAKKDITITWTTNQGWIEDSEKALVEKFTEETGIKVDYQVIPSDQYQTVLTTKLNSGEITDVYMHQNGKFDLAPIYHDDKNAVDLTDEEWVSRMDPGAIEHNSVDGRLYGQTIWDFTPTWVITYNKEIFAKYNLSVPTNYEEFKAVCQTLLDNGITPITGSAGDGWPHVLWFLEIGPAYEAAEPGLEDKLNNNEMGFADSAILEKSLTQYKEMVDLGFFGKNYLSDKFGDHEKNMASGQYAMVLHNMSEPQQIEAAFPEVKADTFGYFLDPLADNQIVNCGPQGPTRFINANSKYIPEIKQLFAYLAEPENLQYMIDNDPKKLTLCFSGLKDKYNDAQKEFMNRYPEKGTVMQISVKYVNPQWMDIGKDLVSMFTGKMTPKDVLTQIDVRRADQAKAANDPAWSK